MFHDVKSGQVCCVRPPKHFEGISVFLIMAPEKFKINSLGAFYFFSECKAAFILLLNIETCFLLYSVCFSYLALAVKVQTHLFQ